jgi:hypothetical protein
MFADIQHFTKLTDIQFGFQTITDNPAADGNMSANWNYGNHYHTSKVNGFLSRSPLCVPRSNKVSYGVFGGVQM